MSTVVTSAVGASAETLVLHLLFQIIAILLATRAIVYVARRWLGQTDVAGEILAGLVLGPSLLGAIAPNLMHRLFDGSTSTIFTGLAQVGLVFLMFQIGLEFEFKAQLSRGKTAIFAIALGGMVTPFAAGYFAAPWFFARMPLPPPPLLGFRLFFATSMAITAIPILGRIFMELGLSHTRTSALTIGAAAIEDVVGWLILGVISAIVSLQFEPGALMLRIAGLIAYLAAVFLVVRPLFKRALARHLDRSGYLRHTAISWVLIVLFLSAVISSSLGVFAIIGGFVIGVAVHDDRRFVSEWKARVAPLVNTFFLPLFFAVTGLRTDIGALNSGSAWWQCALVCAIAFSSKFGGSFVASLIAGEDARTSATIGVCMNTRALMELIALNIGYDLGVIPRQMFTMLVLMAIASTYIATPLIRWLMAAQRDPDQPPIRLSSALQTTVSAVNHSAAEDH
ncbi:MAG: cation:proton antiporter [Deltaproteobacteria bacterium]